MHLLWDWRIFYESHAAEQKLAHTFSSLFCSVSWPHVISLSKCFECLQAHLNFFIGLSHHACILVQVSLWNLMLSFSVFCFVFGSFKSSRNDHIIEVQLYDDIDVICPFYPQSETVTSHFEYYVIYRVRMWRININVMKLKWNVLSASCIIADREKIRECYGFFDQ